MFSNNLKEIRMKKGLSQFKLAEKSGISQGNISQYEQGKIYPTIYTVESLCKILEITATELLGF